MKAHSVAQPDLDKSKLTAIKLINDARKAFLEADSDAKFTFSNKLKKINDIAYLYTDVIDGKTYRIFGVRKDKQKQLNFDEFRRQIAKELELHDIEDACQIVGDSAIFSEVGTKFARSDLQKMFEKENKCMFFYGFTGGTTDNGRLADTNHLISEIADENPERAKRIIANVVDKHTITAIKEWGCSISNSISNFMLVYSNSKEPEVEFGGDTSLDPLTNKKVKCLDGGIQSLLQLLNLVDENVVVEGINQLRNGKNKKMYHPVSKKPYISACEFLSFIKTAISTLEAEPTKEDISSIINKYLEKHELYDSTRRDGGTKEALWQAALKILYKPGFLNKLDLFKCVEAPPDSILILTDIGGDIDDALALLHAIEAANITKTNILGVITSHIEPEEKARQAKLILTESGRPDIPVYSGIGVTRKDSKLTFKSLYPCFPNVFGFPNPDKGDKEWHPKQASAYKDNPLFRAKFKKMKIEDESGADAIIRLANQFSSAHKLVIVGLGPLHDLAAALDKDSSIADKIKLYTMGGIHPKGYNWLISPDITKKVISRVETICVSNDFIVKNKLSIQPDELQEIVKNTHSSFGKAFLTDWKNWKRAELPGNSETMLYDPATLGLAMYPSLIKSLEMKKISFPPLPTSLATKPYNAPEMKDHIMLVGHNYGTPISFVNQLHNQALFRRSMLSSISSQLTKRPVYYHRPFLRLPMNRRVMVATAGLFAVGMATKKISNVFSSLNTKDPTFKKS